MIRLYRLLLNVALTLAYAGILNTQAAAQFEMRAKATGNFLGSGIAAADFNADGKLDVAVTGNELYIFLGNGDGTFRKSATYPELSQVIASADFNGDGIPDLALYTGNNKLSVLLGKGDGTFQDPIVSYSPSTITYMAVADMNNDHKSDLVLIDFASEIIVLLGDGDGSFQPPFVNDSFVGAHQLAVGDFNNDHKLDVAVVGYSFISSGFGIMLGNGNGTLQPVVMHDLTINPNAIGSADFNSDGNTDLAIGEYLAPGLNVLLGNGDGSFRQPVFYDTTAEASQILTADLNGDGKLDLVTPNNAKAGGATVRWGNGDGSFKAAQVYQAWNSGQLVVGDFNGDGQPDLVMGNGISVITMLNTGTVKFSPTAPVSFPVQVVGTINAPKTVQLQNIGSKALSISSFTSTGDFQVTDTCGKTVAPGATCKINVIFEPKAEGSIHGKITLRDSASTRPQTILLTGPSTPLAVSPSKLNFGNQKVGTTSPSRQIAVTNASSATVIFKAIQVGGIENNDFQQTNTCGSQIAVDATCTISVTFTPAKAGIRNANVNVELVGVPNPPFVILTGTGTQRTE